MIYLDYSATTKVAKEVVDTFIDVSNKFYANPNSLHKLGLESKKLIDAATKQVASILNVTEKEIIYTSGATESNNMAIYGVINKYSNRNRHIVTTTLEHSSINESLKYLELNGYKISYVKLDDYGRVDLEDLDRLLKEEPVLVTISSVNSETGAKQDLNKISELIRKYPKTIFHSDVTQSIGKEKIDLSCVDLASFSAQKFYGFKGIGGLVKKEYLDIVPLIKGGKSVTPYRSGTPPVELIASLAKALRLAYIDIDSKYEKVLKLNKYLKEKLNNIEEIHINSNEYCIPHIVNISVMGIKPETMLHALEQHDIFVSTKTACSSDNDYSQAVYSITNNMEYAKHSIRISISYLTTEEELNVFVDKLEEEICKLKVLKS